LTLRANVRDRVHAGQRVVGITGCGCAGRCGNGE
jgi:hypothetical protein